MTTTYSMTAAEISHVRHELCIANDTAKAVCSMIAKIDGKSAAHSLLKQTTEKLDEILNYIDGERAEKQMNASTHPPAATGTCDAILVDDDPLVQGSWKLQARQAGKTLRIYGSAEDLLATADSLNPNTPVYIDFRLGNKKKQGMELAEELYHRGFRELYLSTGLNKDDLPATAIIKGVIGKNPPWIR